MAGRRPRRTVETIEAYNHDKQQRANNPPEGLVSKDTDPDDRHHSYAYDPHLDPQLQWAGKAERTSFEVPTVSLHVHERIEPLTIMEAVRKQAAEDLGARQLSFFGQTQENPPLRDAMDFYHHAHGWSNRLVAGDSLLVMNSLLQKESLAGQVQMIYIDPPYGIKYGSNFQPFVNKRDVKDGSDEDLTAEPEQIRAFRDTWELGIHSYLSYLRDRLLLVRDLLTESGSIFVQISAENVQHVRELMDEVFGAGDFVSQIIVRKSGMMMGSLLKAACYYLLWYARDKTRLKYRQIYQDKVAGSLAGSMYVQLESPDGKTSRRLTDEEVADPSGIPSGWRPYRLMTLATGGFRENTTIPYQFKGQVFHLGAERCWRTTKDGLDKLASLGRIEVSGKTLAYKAYVDDFPAVELTNIWTDTGTGGSEGKVYVVQTPAKVIARCLLMTTDPGDLVLDPTCGSGTTAFVAEKWGRRWITCDTSRVALALTRQRLMTAAYEYYELARPAEGVASNFRYETVPHITLKSIANNEPTLPETLYDKPLKNSGITRVSGPFTVEAVPAPTVRSIEELMGETPSAPRPADASIARSGPTCARPSGAMNCARGTWQGRTYIRCPAASGRLSLAARRGETRPSTEGNDRLRGLVRPIFRCAWWSASVPTMPAGPRQVDAALEERKPWCPSPGWWSLRPFVIRRPRRILTASVAFSSCARR